jgi:hypothetical protein
LENETKDWAEKVILFVKRICFGTVERTWTTVGALAGVLLSFFVGGMGLAVGGTAYAVWTWLLLAFVFGGIGNRIGVEVDKRSVQMRSKSPSGGREWR